MERMSRLSGARSAMGAHLIFNDGIAEVLCEIVCDGYVFFVRFPIRGRLLEQMLQFGFDPSKGPVVVLNVANHLHQREHALEKAFPPRKLVGILYCGTTLYFEALQPCANGFHLFADW